MMIRNASAEGVGGKVKLALDSYILSITCYNRSALGEGNL